MPADAAGAIREVRLDTFHQPKQGHDMTDLLGLGRIAAVAAVLGLPATGMAQPTVTFAGFGGVTQEAVMKGLFADADKLGIKIKEDRSGAWPGIKAFLQSGAQGWDMTEIGFARCEQAAQADMIMPIDYSIVDKSKIPANLALPKYVGVFTFAYGVTYQNKKYGKNGPQNWIDFFDTVKFPGRRSMLGEGLYSLEAALMADGVAAADIYKVLRTPAGIDRAFAKLEKLKPHVSVWWRSTGQAMQLMRDGEVDMAVFPNGRALALTNDGSDITYVWNQSFVDTECFMLPKNTANSKAAMQLINLALEPKNQAVFATMIGYGPVNLKAFDTGILKEKDLAWLPTSPQNLPKQVWADQTWYASPEAEAAYLRYSKFLQ